MENGNRRIWAGWSEMKVNVCIGGHFFNNISISWEYTPS